MLNKRLIQLRKKANLKQEELAKILGIARTTYGMYEQGKRNPDYDILTKIANFYKVKTDYLLGLTDVTNDDDFDPMSEINRLLHKYGIEQSGFHDIDRWKAMGPEELKELENYFKYITDMAKKKNDQNNDH